MLRAPVKARVGTRGHGTGGGPRGVTRVAPGLRGRNGGCRRANLAIGSTLIGLIGSPRSTSRQRAAERMGALAGFAIVAGILSVVMLRACFGAFSGHVVALCAIAALTVFASAAATAGIQAAAGPVGTGVVILVFVILGNSASGGPFARPLLPGFWRTIGGILPPGASVDLARSALFFDGARSRARFSCSRHGPSSAWRSR
jgi:hypothetical protein